MKNRLVAFSLLYAIIFCASISAEPESDEPVELARLKEQFKKKIDMEMKPWRDKYAQELQKLEDRLVKDRKLAEALVVKNEKDNYLTAELHVKQEEQAIIKNPTSEQELKDVLVNSVWLVYSSDDKKRERLLDVYYFMDSKQIFLLNTKTQSNWKVNSSSEALIQMAKGEISLEISMSKATASAEYADQTYNLFYAGKPKR
jgi:hypothetical protein